MWASSDGNVKSSLPPPLQFLGMATAGALTLCTVGMPGHAYARSRPPPEVCSHWVRSMQDREAHPSPTMRAKVPSERILGAVGASPISCSGLLILIRASLCGHIANESPVRLANV